MLNRFQLPAVLILSAIIWTGVLWFGKQSLSWELAQPYGITAGTMAALLVAFDRWVWHWPILRGWLVTTPNIDGTWDVSLRSSYVDNNGTAIGPISAKLVATQTHSSLIVRLVSEKSASHTIGYDIRDTGGGVFEIMGVYINEPRYEFREPGGIHYGTFKLQLIEGAAPELIGHYWTDRKTSGTFVATNKRARKVGDMQRAGSAATSGT